MRDREARLPGWQKARNRPAFRRRSPVFPGGRGTAPDGQAPPDLNRDVSGCPPNLRDRTHAIPTARTGQMAVAPARAITSPSISTVITTANAIMGASRMRLATTAVDAQFRKLLIAPSRTPAFSHCRHKCELTEAGPTTCLTLARMRRHPRETADLAMPTPPHWCATVGGFNPLSKLETQFDLDRFRVWGVVRSSGRSRTNTEAGIWRRCPQPMRELAVRPGIRRAPRRRSVGRRR